MNQADDRGIINTVDGEADSGRAGICVAVICFIAEAVCAVVVGCRAVVVGRSAAPLQDYDSMLGRGDDAIAQTVSINITALQGTAGITVFICGVATVEGQRDIVDTVDGEADGGCIGVCCAIMDPVAEAVCTVVVVIGAVAVGWAIAALQCYGTMLGRVTIL